MELRSKLRAVVLCVCACLYFACDEEPNDGSAAMGQTAGVGQNTAGVTGQSATAGTTGQNMLAGAAGQGMTAGTGGQNLAAGAAGQGMTAGAGSQGMTAGTGSQGMTAGTGSQATAGTAAAGQAGSMVGTAGDGAGMPAAGTGGMQAGMGGGGVGAADAGTAMPDGGAADATPDTGAPGGFSPCPDTEPCRILPLGDSITVGLQSPSGGGYREPLFERAVNAGQSITFVGTQAGGPSMVAGQPFPRSHEGFSGQTIGFIAGRVPSPALDDDPHIVLLMIGTNDMYMGPSGAPERLASLVDELLEALPMSLIVVAQLTPFPGAASAVQTYNAAIPPIVEERASAGEHILLVDMFTDFPADTMLADGVHPNGSGYDLMAERWYAAIGDVLKSAP